MNKPCVVCGKPFNARGGSAIYCSDACRRRAKGQPPPGGETRERKPSRVCVPACGGCFANQEGRCGVLDECLAARRRYGGKCPFYKETLAYLRELYRLHGTVAIYRDIHGPGAWEKLKASGMVALFDGAAPARRKTG